MARKIIDWGKIRQEYISQPEMSINDLMAKYKLSTQIFTVAKKEGWVEAKEAYQREVQEIAEQKTKEQDIQRRVEANNKHNEMYDKLLAAAENLLSVFEEAGETKEFNRATTAANLAYLAEVVQKAQKGQRTALNMDTEQETDSSPRLKFVIEGITLDDI